MARLTLSLLGGFQARLGAGPALALPTKKIQAFLAYLTLAQGQEHSRDKLAALLWGPFVGARPEQPSASALRPPAGLGGRPPNPPPCRAPDNRLDRRCRRRRRGDLRAAVGVSRTPHCSFEHLEEPDARIA
jgi:hypothetical protein